ncbi:uncharacterized protein TRAVEDRAFT_31761 [Trametes versicolor FP-101664 SS1]|uniref:uncharacterized protein n=1 Tax=Trametes versicolor (strain FP-101664) TaxID=717944 RepID=UPI0004621EEC|nr:uncharacterized protein TRAVEDRAFT_31761 [Trametes versicolor FP-101664 SS1]EIW52543.1 hypothetical protein TRAVEDRAFT_31761 [Trametes versicolor FP-101664 SS1]
MLLAQAREKELELQGVYALLNAGVPINQLPVELLVEIFARFQSVDDPSHYWANVLRVCRHWFVVGSTAGNLWTNLKVSDSTNLLRTGLFRSSAAEFSVEMVCARTHPLTEAAAFVAPHMHRLRGLRLGRIPSTSVPALVEFMDNAMPALRHFHATGDERGRNLTLRLSPECFPRLEDLRVSHICVWSNLPIFPQLRTLHISGRSVGAPTLKTATLLESLRRMENIEDLVLSGVLVSDLGGSPSFASKDRVVLRKLRKLVVNMEGPLIKQMLSVITIPPEATVHFSSPVRGTTAAGNSANMAGMLPEDRRAGLPVLACITEAWINTSATKHIVAGYTAAVPASTRGAVPPVLFILELPEANDLGGAAGAGIGLAGLVEVFRDSPLESVTVETSSSIVAQVEWRDFFAALPTLRRLDFTTIPDALAFTPDLMFAALDPGPGDTLPPSSTVEEDAGLGTAAGDVVLCPSLRRMRLHRFPADLNALLDTVETCLENRRRRLGNAGEHALEELVLNVVDQPNHAAFLVARAAFVERMVPLVGTFACRNSQFI